MARVLLALGSNLGDREAAIRAAIAALAATPGVRVLATSGLRETAPVGGPEGQPAFVNAGALVDADIDAEALLDRLQAIEAELGRARDRAGEPRWGPRRLDIDIAFWDDRVIETERLSVPHPRAAERRFVLEPLCELAPEYVHPTLGKTLRELLTGLADR